MRGYPGICFRRAGISRIVLEYDRVFTFFVDRPEGLEFRPGQYTHLVAPGGYINNNDVRHMSFANAPSEEGLMFTMDLASGSRYKRRFASAKVGDRVGLYSEKGEFTLDGIPVGSPLVLIAGGVGITPFRSMIRAGIDHPWHLIYVGRAFCYEGFWDSLNPENLTFVDRGGFEKAVESRMGAETVFLLCGSGGFVDAASRCLKTGGVEDTRIRVENFSSDHGGDG